MYLGLQCIEQIESFLIGYEMTNKIEPSLRQSIYDNF